MENNIKQMGLEIQLIRYDLMNYLASETYQKLTTKHIKENIRWSLKWINRFISETDNNFCKSKGDLFYGKSKEFEKLERNYDLGVQDMINQLHNIQNRINKLGSNPMYKNYFTAKSTDMLIRSSKRIDTYKIKMAERLINNGIIEDDEIFFNTERFNY